MEIIPSKRECPSYISLLEGSYHDLLKHNSFDFNYTISYHYSFDECNQSE